MLISNVASYSHAISTIPNKLPCIYFSKGIITM